MGVEKYNVISEFQDNHVVQKLGGRQNWRGIEVGTSCLMD